jgi:catechol 2,3-dioxygenase-like lactoylglutathione lyase family enzyme
VSSSTGESTNKSVNKSESEWSVRALLHINLNVSDIDRSILFYEALGFEILGRNDAKWSPETGELLGVPGAQGRACIMTLPGDVARSTKLDLLEWTHPKSPPRAVCAANDAGAPRIALRVHNLEAAYRGLAKDGVEFITPPAGAAPELGIANVVCCRDPDGFIVELVELVRSKRSN